MLTKQRVSLSLPIQLVYFVQSTAKKRQKTQSYVFEEALKILQKLLEEKELKDAYLNESSDDFADLAVGSYYEDILKHAS